VVFASPATERQAGGGHSHRHTTVIGTPQSSAHTPKKPESRIAAKQRTGSLAWRYTGSVTNTTYTRSCYKTDMHKSRAPDRLTTTCCTAVPDICGSAVRDWQYITLLVPRILRWFLHLWIICAPLLHITLKSSMTSRLHNLMHRFVYNILRPLIPPYNNHMHQPF